MNIEDIKNLCKDETIEASQHFAERCRKRGLTYKEAKEAICVGEVIETYIDDYPHPSCLLIGKTKNGKIVHVVVGLTNDRLWLITVYEPDRDRWDKSLKLRKEN